MQRYCMPGEEGYCVAPGLTQDLSGGAAGLVTQRNSGQAPEARYGRVRIGELSGEIELGRISRRLLWQLSEGNG
jgi:hypothetical protein